MRDTLLIQISGQNIFGITGLLLVKIYRNDIKANRGNTFK